jgi:hypothetical protein
LRVFGGARQDRHLIRISVSGLSWRVITFISVTRV